MQDIKKKTDFRALLIIVDSNIREKLSEFLSDKQVPIYMQMHGMGTAKSEFLSMSGLGDIHKAITLCFVPRSRTQILLAEMNQALKLHKRGTGIAISIPMTGMQGWLYKLLDSQTVENDEEDVERDVKKMNDAITHALILVSINLGYSDDVMNTARAAGATGGTVLKGLRCSPEKAAKVFSITIQEEQEIVAIVAPKEKKVDIMTAISSEHGLNSPAHGVALSLPVDAIMGL